MRIDLNLNANVNQNSHDSFPGSDAIERPSPFQLTEMVSLMKPAVSPSESGRPFGSRVIFVMEPGDTADFDTYDSSFNMWFPKGC